MSLPPIPEPWPRILADAAARCEAAGEPVTARTIAEAVMRGGELPGSIIPWALEVAAGEYLRDRA